MTTYRPTHRETYRATSRQTERDIFGPYPIYEFNLKGPVFSRGSGFTNGGPSSLVRLPWTFTRATTKYVEDHEGVWRLIPSGAAPLSGFRNVWNLYSAAADEQPDSWPAGGNTTVSAETVTGPYGSDVTAYRIQMPAATLSFCWQDDNDLGLSGLFGGSIDIQVTLSAWVKRFGALDSNYSIRCGTSSQETNLVATDTWQRMAVTETVTLDGNSDFGFDNRSNTEAIDILVYLPMLEVGDTPSEPVELDVDYGFGVNGFRYFTTTNGNSVTSNVVTEAAGSTIAIDDARGDTTPGVWGRQGYVPEPARTNLITLSYDLTTWSIANSTGATEALDAVGITGASNTATTIGDGNSGGSTLWFREVTVADSAQEVTSVFAWKHVASPSHFPGCRVKDVTTGNVLLVMVNPSTGATSVITNSIGGSAAVAESVRIGDYIFTTLVAPNSSGNTEWQVAAYPCLGTSFGSEDATATGSSVFGHAEINDSASTRTSPIVTNGSTATRNLDVFGISALGESEHSAVIDWHDTNTAPGYLLASLSTARTVYTQSGEVRPYDGTTVSDLVSYTESTINKVAYSVDGSNINMSVNGGAVASQGHAVDYSALQFTIGGLSTEASRDTIRSVKIYDRVLADAQLVSEST